MLNKIVLLTAALSLFCAIPSAHAASSCTPSASITEYYLDGRGNPQSQTLTTLTKPVVVSATFADYHNSEPPCSTKQMNNGSYNCPDWEIPTMTIEGPNTLGAIDDADVNSTIEEFDLRDGDGPYTKYTIPSVNPSALTYTNAPSPEWKVVTADSMDGTCHKITIGNAGEIIGDVLEESGTYSTLVDLCEHNNAECNESAEGRGGSSTDEHWVVVAMDSTGVQSLPDVSAEVGENGRGTCAVIGGAYSGGYETISDDNTSTCPGDQNAN